MKTRYKSILIALVILLVCCLSIYIFSGDNGRSRTSDNYYAFDPESLRESPVNGNQDVFHPVSLDVVDNASDSVTPISWTQSDYLMISNAVYELIWHESSATWKISLISFHASCREVGNGFETSVITYVKTTLGLQGFSNIEREIHIEPRRGLVRAFEYDYGESFVRFKSVDINDLLISADEILVIAEDHGGMQVRLKNEDNCSVSVALSPNSVNYRGWRVRYSPDLLDLSIDPKTGKVVK